MTPSNTTMMMLIPEHLLVQSCANVRCQTQRNIIEHPNKRPHTSVNTSTFARTLSTRTHILGTENCIICGRHEVRKCVISCHTCANGSWDEDGVHLDGRRTEERLDRTMTAIWLSKTSSQGRRCLLVECLNGVVLLLMSRKLGGGGYFTYNMQ